MVHISLKGTFIIMLWFWGFETFLTVNDILYSNLVFKYT